MVKTRSLMALVATVLLGSSVAVPAVAQVEEDEALDFSDAPFVSYQPVPPLPDEISHYPLPDGADDYWDLWADDAPWREVAQQIDAFHMHAWMFRYSATDEQLRELFAWLDEHELPLGLEVEPLTWKGADVCDHRESMEGPYDLIEIERIHRLGGRLDYLTLDQPFANGHVYAGLRACGYTVEEVVDEVWAWVGEVRRYFPGIAVGSIEPVVSHLYLSERDFATWLDTWEARTGEPLAFLNIDVDWRIEDWPERVMAIEALADARGVPFGMLYLGSEDSRQNDTWLEQQMAHAVRYEQVHGGTPQMAGLWSWHSQPDRTLPDDDLNTSSGRVKQYFGERTALKARAIQAMRIEGRMATTADLPVAGERLTLTAEPIGRARQRHRFSGVVPEAARKALIAVRANTEGGTPSPVDVRISEVSYKEGTGKNRVPNARFSRGLDSWGSYGSGVASAVTNEDGPAMRIKAKPHETLMVDGARFKVRSGARFEFAATLDVPAKALGSGYVSLIFFDQSGQETQRENIWFATRPVSLRTVTTDADGRFAASLRELGPGRYDIVVSYPGTTDRWPADSEPIRVRVR